MGACLVRRRLATVLALTALSFGAASTRTGEPDSTKFRIQDYIPERFTDFQWRLRGWLRTNENENSNDVSYSDFVKPDLSAVRHESQSVSINASSNWEYQYQTQQRSFDATLALTTYNSRDNHETNHTLIDTLQTVSTESSESRYTDGSFNLPLKANYLTYLSGDAFLSAGGSFNYSYGQFGSNQDYVTHEISSVGSGDTLRTYHAEGGGEYRRISRRIDFEGEIRLGWGRVYSGQYAATAIMIVNELRDAGLMARAPNREDMLELTRLIHAFREGHGFDSREYRTRSLRAIVGNLYQKGIIPDQNTAVLLRVEDVLDYYPIAARRFGWAAQLGFGGRDIYYNNESDRVTRERITVHLTDPENPANLDTTYYISEYDEDRYGSSDFSSTDHVAINLSYHRPLNVRWQLDISAISTFYLNSTVPSDYRVRYSGFNYFWSIDRKFVSANVGLQYFYDARTTLSMICTFTDSTRTDQYEEVSSAPAAGGRGRVEEWDRHERALRFRLGCVYRLSPTTSLDMDWNYARRVYSIENSPYVYEFTNRDISFTVQITHWLF
jgi:hypothetical protein